MRKIMFIIEKEFRQIKRNKLMIPIIFVMPFVQLYVLSYTANFTVNDIKIFINDSDITPLSTKLTNKIFSSANFTAVGTSTNYATGYELIKSNKADVILSIPENFNKNLVNNSKSSLSINIDAIDGMKAGVTLNYLQNIISDFLEEYSFSKTTITLKPGIQMSERNWYNPNLDYKMFMVPAILVMLVTMITFFLNGINIVKEKEIGTIEQLNVTPIKKYQFMIGKITPFIIIAFIEFTFGMIFARIVFDIIPKGSIFLIYSYTFFYILLIIGISMFVANFMDTQQQTMLISWFILVIYNLLSGMFTPIESMPVWAQDLTYLIPTRYYNEFMRMVILKGSSFNDVKTNFLIIAVSSIVINAIAVKSYKKTI
jgi:ABC-2 type transport system permease protein